MFLFFNNDRENENRPGIYALNIVFARFVLRSRQNKYE